jgi:hypothetical protein
VVSSYLTIARHGEAEIEVRRSRLRCTLVRVEDEPAARVVGERWVDAPRAGPAH